VGYIGVDATYRLAPLAVWPAGAEDLAAAVQWVSDNIGGAHLSNGLGTSLLAARAAQSVRCISSIGTYDVS
jgi:acetyl esterase/lipase